MDDKTNLYVFEKKEVFLIFIFMILIAITSFVLGVKVGKSFTYGDVPMPSEQRVEGIDFLSDREEEVRRLLNEAENQAQDDHLSRVDQALARELREEEERVRGLPQVNLEAPQRQAPSSPQAETRSYSREELRGKHTIQLGSYPSIREAERFADAFKVRGYNPIIQEVELPERGGIWYRVSIGVFDTLTQAKEYVIQERQLFEGEDYIFQRF